MVHIISGSQRQALMRWNEYPYENILEHLLVREVLWCSFTTDLSSLKVFLMVEEAVWCWQKCSPSHKSVFLTDVGPFELEEWHVLTYCSLRNQTLKCLFWLYWSYPMLNKSLLKVHHIIMTSIEHVSLYCITSFHLCNSRILFAVKTHFSHVGTWSQSNHHLLRRKRPLVSLLECYVVVSGHETHSL